MGGKKQVIAYLHTHWDREWYRTKEEFNLRLLEVFDEILEELETGSMPCFYFDGQTAALEDYLKFRPEKLKLVTKLIKAQKLRVGPFFVSPDNFLVSGISLIRNLDIGIKYSKSLGESEFIGYLADTFGHSKSIFNILKSFDILYALVWRGVGALSANDFKMNGVNTTKLAAGYFMDVLHYISGFSPEDKEFSGGIKTLCTILDKIAQNSSGDLLLPVGADHLAGLKNSSWLVKEVNKHLENYEIKLASPFEYVKNADYTRLSLDGELLDNSETYILPGVYSSRIPQKAYNARLQWDLFRITEPMCYFMEKMGLKTSKYKPSLDYAAKELIKNHAHDSIYGCSIDEVHNHVQTRFDKAFEVTEGVKHRLVRDFKCQFACNSLNKTNSAAKNSNPPKSRCEKIGVFNFSNHEYTGPIKFITDFPMQNAQLVRKFKGFSDEILYDTRQIPVTEQYLPRFEYLAEVKGLLPFSFTPVELVKPACRLEISDTKIANPYLELNLRCKKGKFELEFKDKMTGAKFLNPLKILESKDFGDSYNSACPLKPNEIKLVGAKVIEKGLVRAGLRLLFEKNFKLDVYLTNEAKFFSFEAKFNNNKKNRKIQMCLNLKNPIDTTFAEDAFGYIERKHDYNWLSRDYMPAKPRIEVKSNSYPFQRWLLAQDFGVVTVGLNEYEVYKNELKIAIIRSTQRISEPKNLARFVPAGPPIETPNLQCLGFHTLKFAVLLNPTIASIQQVADTYYEPTVALLGDFESKCHKKDQNIFLKLPQNLIFYGLKPNDDKACGVFYNSGDKKITYKGKTIHPKTIAFIEL